MHYVQVEFDHRRAATGFNRSVLENKLSQAVNVQIVMKNFISEFQLVESENVVLTFKTDRLEEVLSSLQEPTFKSGSAVYWEVKGLFPAES
ncbi:hypothetical protein OV208_32180 [Corallococcus sp. bb12-1]|uniref:hypothetical protein n=1 Tax=Corallococcus sp. bb12-1 TaxID=2996784 RepID=UPI00226F93DE|nr:hypothetical protein [Corallococcus sp. bb12-1]MCY1046016.1 hypothetical protein [Corallococcus sp. bb12-1]